MSSDIHIRIDRIGFHVPSYNKIESLLPCLEWLMKYMVYDGLILID